MNQTMNLQNDGAITPNESVTTALRRHYLLMVQKHKGQPQPVPLYAQNTNASRNANTEGNASQTNSPELTKKNISEPKKWLIKSGLTVIFMALLVGLAVQITEQQREKSLRLLQANRLKTISLAARVNADNHVLDPKSAVFAMGSGATAAEMLIDPVSGKPFVFVEGDDRQPEKVIAYSPWIEGKGGACALGDGSVQSYTPERFKAFIQSLPTRNATTPTSSNGN